ncbi:chemotaxis protein CheY [Sorangium cellulosum]|uniref:Chemotaxis protein CheY n=1 Tax=Sorangium cellulosum TaxID=56 RepID=A0A2L0F729_SORCE|nr:LytTR family DNA-binding domain-containing protein [Sorangium cellulosum]AUX47311.1 chemotaxis protein CheY [Sorangium cellulosum]
MTARPLRVLVVDDEALARARLIRMLGRVANVEVVAEAATGLEALEQMRALRPDLLLLDVEMPGMDGFGVADAVDVVDGGDVPLVVFTTAHAQHAALAFDADAVDYLLKPVAQERLARALDKVAHRLLARERAGPGPTEDESGAPRVRPHGGAGREAGGAPPLLCVHDAGRILFFDPRRITRFRAEDKYTTFALDGEEHLVRESLSTLEERLSGLGFLRVHRSELVRADAIRALEPEPGGAVLHLSDGQSVSVSRRFLPSLKQALGIR